MLVASPRSYASLYYLAFLQYTGISKVVNPIVYNDDGFDDDGQGMLYALELDLVIIFGAALAVQNGMSIILPRIQSAQKFKAEGGGTKEAENGMSVPELQYLMLPFDQELEVLMQYNALVLQLGYVVLFAVAFPGAPLCAFLTNYASIRVDGKKYMKLMRRAVPIGAQDIGTWYTIIEIMSILAIVTNSAIVCFKMDKFGDFDEITLAKKEFYFMLFTYFLCMIFLFFKMAIPDVPQKVTIQLQRATFIEDKIIKHVADEDDEINVTQKPVSLEISERDAQGDYYMTIADSFVV